MPHFLKMFPIFLRTKPTYVVVLQVAVAASHGMALLCKKKSVWQQCLHHGSTRGEAKIIINLCANVDVKILFNDGIHSIAPQGKKTNINSQHMHECWWCTKTTSGYFQPTNFWFLKFCSKQNQSVQQWHELQWWHPAVVQHCSVTTNPMQQWCLWCSCFCKGRKPKSAINLCDGSIRMPPMDRSSNAKELPPL